jgi:hypothetical protein
MFHRRGSELWSGGSVDRPIDSPTTGEGRVGGIDDRIDFEGRDVGAKQLDHAMSLL